MADLTMAQVLEILNITPWQWRSLRKRLPRIVYSRKTIRYAEADVMHLRESLKTGGWIAPIKQEVA